MNSPHVTDPLTHTGPRDLILIAMVGRSDLQLAFNGQRMEFPRGPDLRRIHQAILNLDIPCEIIDDQGLPYTRQSFDLKKLADESPLHLLAPKLMEMVRYLADENQYRIRACVIFGTHRDELIEPSEPIASAPVIAEWLAKLFGLEATTSANEVGPDKSGWVLLATGQQRLSGEDRDYPVARHVMRAADTAIRQLRQQLPDSDVVLSLQGGPPPLKDPIKACINYRFGATSTHLWEYRDREHTQPWLNAEQQPAQLSDSFRFREIATALVNNADFHGAYAAVKHLQTDPVEQEWVFALHQIVDFLDGSLPFLPQYLTSTDTPSVPRCLLPAIRVEVALGAERYAEAVFWTSSFMDAALSEFIQKMEYPATMNDLDQTLTYPKGRQPRHELTHPSDPQQRPLLKQHSPQSYRFFNGPQFSHRWLDMTPEKDLGFLAQAMTRIEQGLKQYAYSTTMKRKVSPRQLRNLNTHGVLDWWHVGRKIPSFEQTGFKAMITHTYIQSGLWTEPATGQYSFLNNPDVRYILNAHEIPDVHDLYQRMTSGLLAVMANHEVA